MTVTNGKVTDPSTSEVRILMSLKDAYFEDIPEEEVKRDAIETFDRVGIATMCTHAEPTFDGNWAYCVFLVPNERLLSFCSLIEYTTIMQAEVR